MHGQSGVAGALASLSAVEGAFCGEVVDLLAGRRWSCGGFGQPLFGRDALHIGGTACLHGEPWAWRPRSASLLQRVRSTAVGSACLHAGTGVAEASARLSAVGLRSVSMEQACSHVGFGFMEAKARISAVERYALRRWSWHARMSASESWRLRSALLWQGAFRGDGAGVLARPLRSRGGHGLLPSGGGAFRGERVGVLARFLARRGGFGQRLGREDALRGDGVCTLACRLQSRGDHGQCLCGGWCVPRRRVRRACTAAPESRGS